ncbi:MAG: phage tail protein [Anaerolineales bacterium]|nr:phage tail protein [Anaerolineales bacterium]
MAGEAKDPLVGFHFAVDFQGVVAGYFTECNGLGSETEIIEHKIINEKGVEIMQKIPGRLKWENITLKRGITEVMDFWEWRQQVEDGDVDGARRDGSIVMFNQKLEPVARWDFRRAWPVKVSGPQPKSDSNAIGIEELTIAHEYIRREKM